MIVKLNKEQFEKVKHIIERDNTKYVCRDMHYVIFITEKTYQFVTIMIGKHTVIDISNTKERKELENFLYLAMLSEELLNKDIEYIKDLLNKINTEL